MTGQPRKEQQRGPLLRREVTVPDKSLESWRKPDVGYLDVDDGEHLVVAGREVPHVQVRRINNEFLGFRFTVGYGGGDTIDCSIDDAPHIAALIANAIAVGAGFTGWPDEEHDFVPRPFAPKVTLITGLDGEHS